MIVTKLIHLQCIAPCTKLFKIQVCKVGPNFQNETLEMARGQIFFWGGDFLGHRDKKKAVRKQTFVKEHRQNFNHNAKILNYSEVGNFENQLHS